MAPAAAFYSVLDGLNRGVTIHDSSARVIYCNPSLRTLVGHRDGELVGRPLHAAGVTIVDERGASFPLDDCVRHAAVTGQPVSGLTVAVARRDTSVRSWVTLDVVPLTSSWNQPIVVCTFTDVTAERDIAEKLHRLDQHYRRFIDTAYEGIWLVDAEWKTILVNRRMAAMLGYEIDEMIGRPIDDFLDEGMSAQFAGNQQRRSHGVAEQFDFRYVHKTGRPVWGIVSASPIFDERGEFAGSLAMVTDVTTRKEAEERTRISEERYRSLVMSGATMVWSSDGEGQAMNDSPAWGVFTGQSRGEYERFGWLEVIHPDDRQSARDVWTNAIASGTPFESIYRLRRNDGEYRYVAARGVPIRADDGTVREWVGTITDVHAQREAEEALRRSEEESRRLREELHRISAVTMVSIVTASIAHDVTQPLTAIRTNAEAMLRFLDRPDNRSAIREALQDVIADASRASDLIDRTRHHLQTGTPAWVPLEMEGVVNDVVRVLRRTAEERAIQLVNQKETLLPPVMGDRLELQQVVANLLMNAFDAVSGRPEGQRGVTIAMEHAENWVTISVTDSGEGATDEELARMFEPLFTSKPEGMGLGLTICAAIVARHAGSIRVARNPKAGLTFMVALPVALSPPVE